MKRVIVILSLFVTCVFSSLAQDCDTLKWKSLKAYYGDMVEDSFHKIGKLDSATINVDTLPYFHPGINIVNTSNDTFYANEDFAIAVHLAFYTDTGIFGWDRWHANTYYFGRFFSPDDTIHIGVHIKAELQLMINAIKEVRNIELEQIRYWRLITGVLRTSKDGYYSDSVFYAGADTSIFYVVRGGVSVEELTMDNGQLTIFPNPTTGQLKITLSACRFGTKNYELREGSVIEIYNIMGQVVLRNTPLNPPSKGETAAENSPFKGGRGMSEITIDVSHLAKGMYFLKVGNQTTKFIKE